MKRTSPTWSRAHQAGFIVLLLAAMLFSARDEGYLPLISPFFAVVLAFGFALSFWLALRISAARIAALIATILLLEYVKETIGVRSGLWVYHGKEGRYFFGIFAWVVGGLSAHSVSTGVTIPLLRRLHAFLPFWLNLAIAIPVLLGLPMTLGPSWAGAGLDFCILYLALGIVLLLSAILMDFPTFAGIVVAAWLGGNLGEYAGSAASGAWTFPYNPTYPPFFLLFSCWPMEIAAQHSLAAWFSGESLDVAGRTAPTEGTPEGTGT